MPLPLAPIIPGGRNDKLVGNTPLIFTGDRTKAEEFITQWQLYEGVNITNDLMRNAYQQAMLFLTYIQGPIVNEWVKGVNAWLRGQIINQQWAPTDERLWTEVFNSFNRQFANAMEQEDAQAALAKGLQLEKGDLDKLITEFEQLVRHAGYNVNKTWSCAFSPAPCPTPCTSTLSALSLPPQHTNNGGTQPSNSSGFTFTCKTGLIDSKLSPNHHPSVTGSHSTHNGKTPTATQMQWTHHPEERVRELLKQKISSQEGTIMSNVSEEVGKEEYHEDPFKEMVQGKSSNASSVTNQVTLREIVGKNTTAIKDHLAPDKPMKKKQLSQDVSPMKEPLSRGPRIGYQE
jgi:hypothetical protein